MIFRDIVAGLAIIFSILCMLIGMLKKDVCATIGGGFLSLCNVLFIVSQR